MTRLGTIALLSLLASLYGCQGGSPTRTLADYRPDQPEASNMRLLGFNDLQNRSAYVPELHAQGGRWIAYIGHHGGKPKLNPLTGAIEHNGTSIVDVTDPRNPKYLAFQTNNVEVDGRGYIYIVDRADTGMHVLELTGTARDAASFR